MSDEQVQDSRTLDDAYRQADEQLRRKIEELRAIASGTAPMPEPAADTPLPASAGVPPVEPAAEPAPAVPAAAGHGEVADLRVVTPVEPHVEHGGFVPDPTELPEPPAGNDEPPAHAAEPEPWTPPVTTQLEDAPLEHVDEGDALLAPSGPLPDHVEAVAESTPGFLMGPSAGSPIDEAQWETTRRTLAELQQTAEAIKAELPGEISRLVARQLPDDLGSGLAREVQRSLSERIERIVRDELSGSMSALRDLQKQVPAMHDKVKAAVRDELRSELPGRLDTIEKGLAGIESQAGQGEQSMQAAIERIERTLKGQFERIEGDMRQRLDETEEAIRADLEAPAQTTRELRELVDERLRDLERGMQDSAVEEGIRSLSSDIGSQQRSLDEAQRVLDETQRAVDSVHGAIDATREDLRETSERLSSQAAETVEKISGVVRDELTPTRRAVRDLAALQLGPTVEEVRDNSRDALHRITELAEAGELDRVQRVKDLELLIDTMTTGWQGLYKAVGSLLDRVEDFDGRVASVEEKLLGIDELDRSLTSSLATVQEQFDRHLQEVQQHLSELQPAPVLVTVNHPEAQLDTTTRAGYTREPQQRGQGNRKKDSRK